MNTPTPYPKNRFTIVVGVVGIQPQKVFVVAMQHQSALNR
jgi:hypothetical protein